MRKPGRSASRPSARAVCSRTSGAARPESTPASATHPRCAGARPRPATLVLPLLKGERGRGRHAYGSCGRMPCAALLFHWRMPSSRPPPRTARSEPRSWLYGLDVLEDGSVGVTCDESIPVRAGGGPLDELASCAFDRGDYGGELLDYERCDAVAVCVGIAAEQQERSHAGEFHVAEGEIGRASCRERVQV